MSEKQFIDRMTKVGYTAEEAGEIYDFYLSIDCIENIGIVGLMNEMSLKPRGEVYGI